MLNAEKTKTNYGKVITKYYKFVKSDITIFPVYKDVTGSHFKSTEDNLGLSTMLSHFDIFILGYKQDNGEDYITNTVLHFLSYFNTILCKNKRFQRVQ